MVKNNLNIFIMGALIVFSGCNQEVLPPKKQIEPTQKIKIIVKKDVKIKEIVKPKTVDSIVWDGTDEYIYSYDYNTAIKNYVDNKYPKDVKKWNKELKRQERVRVATIEKERKARVKREAKVEKERLKLEAKLKREKLKKERQEKERVRKAQLKRERAYNTKTVGNIMWEDHEDANTNQYTWSQANKFCKSLSWLGYEDWRLPTLTEFLELSKNQNKDKLEHFNIKNTFLNANNLVSSLDTKESWTSTSMIVPSNKRWGKVAYYSYMRLKYGTDTSELNFARCVRKIRR